MCDCDENPPQVYDRAEVTARKPHRCDECRRAIARGERHVVHSGLWRDGGWQTFRWCAHCAAAESILRGAVGDWCCCLGELWDAAWEHRNGWDRPTNRLLDRLCVMARRKWTVRRGPKTGRLMPVRAMAKGVVTSVGEAI